VARHPKLLSAWAKVDRADHHAHVLEAKLREWADAKEDPVIRQRWKNEPELQLTRVFVDSLKPIPGTWGVIIGDALNNYRSALDHLAYTLVGMGASASKLRKESFAKRVEFPYFREPLRSYGVEHSFVKPRLPGVDARYVLALAPFQPGQRPGRGQRGPLHALQRLNNLDKHRKPLLTHHVVTVGRTRGSFTFPVTMVPLLGWRHPKPDTELIRLAWYIGEPPIMSRVMNPSFDPDDLRMAVDFEPTCSIAFGDLKPRIEVQTVLSEVSKAVRQILETAERI
jgi:hypothetical protein